MNTAPDYPIVTVSGSNGRSCAQCRFCAVVTYEDPGETSTLYQCRRYAPMTPGAHDDDVTMSERWPEVDRDDWCGEYQSVE